MITYRILEKGEQERILPILQDQGWFIPYSESCLILAAIDDGEIVGFSVTQLVPHIEPIWVKESYRGSGLALDLAKKAQEQLEAQGVNLYVAGAGNPFAEKLCEAIGMEKVSTAMYVKKGT